MTSLGEKNRIAEKGERNDAGGSCRKVFGFVRRR